MALDLALFSAKGSPGATTLAEALVAIISRDGGALLAELDPDGGDRAAAAGLSIQPGLGSLAAAVRHGEVDEEQLAMHLQPLPAGGHALVAPLSAEQAHAALAAAMPQLAMTLASTGQWTVVADCGRVRSRSPSLEVARHARLSVLVSRPTLDGIEHARERVAALDELGARTAVVLVGRRPYASEEVSAVVGAPVLGVIADDPAGADLVRTGRATSRAGRRSLLMRSVGGLVRALEEGRSSVAIGAIEP